MRGAETHFPSSLIFVTFCFGPFEWQTNSLATLFTRLEQRDPRSVCFELFLVQLDTDKALCPDWKYLVFGSLSLEKSPRCFRSAGVRLKAMLAHAHHR